MRSLLPLPSGKVVASTGLPKPLMDAAADPGVQIVYSGRFRRFGLRHLDPGRAPGIIRARTDFRRLYQVWEIDFCPWTGVALPGDLMDEYARTAEKEYGIKDWSPFDRYRQLPPEFLSDAWWRKRGLASRITNPAARPRWRRPPLVRGKIVETTLTTPVCEDWPKWWIGSYVFLPPGYRRPGGTPPHLCSRMYNALGDIRAMISYLPWTREYGIRILDPRRAADYQRLRIRPILFCPWCGRKLPDSLRPKLREILSQRAYPVRDPEVDASPALYTAYEYASELWWRKYKMRPIRRKLSKAEKREHARFKRKMARLAKKHRAADRRAERIAAKARVRPSPPRPAARSGGRALSRPRRGASRA